MLNFPEEFWKEEIRCDFRVTEAMKRAWAVQMTVLDMVLEIASKHGLRVFMDYGTLLGTVRHHGYIPWDDDIDICVLREDYMKLIYILRDELPDYCQVFSFYTTENYTEPKGFVANRKRIDIGIDPAEAEITKRYYGCPYMTGIDLYPLDYVPQDLAQMDYVKNVYNAVYDLAFNFDMYRANGELEEYLTELEKVTGSKIKRDEHIKNSLWLLADKVAMMTQRRESRHVLWYSDWVASKRDVRRKSTWYQEQVFMPFEMMSVPVPSGYDEALKVRFGEKYMTPMQQKGAHDYPFFAEQEKKIMAYKWGNKLQEIY